MNNLPNPYSWTKTSPPYLLKEKQPKSEYSHSSLPIPGSLLSPISSLCCYLFDKLPNLTLYSPRRKRSHQFFSKARCLGARCPGCRLFIVCSSFILRQNGHPSPGFVEDAPQAGRQRRIPPPPPNLTLYSPSHKRSHLFFPIAKSFGVYVLHRITTTHSALPFSFYRAIFCHSPSRTCLRSTHRTQDAAHIANRKRTYHSCIIHKAEAAL